MDLSGWQQVLAQLNTMSNMLEALELKLNVVDIRVDLMETRFDYRFDLIDEHLAFINDRGIT
ncbi:hypothetical protein [Chitinophaga sp. RAB17]|uniref:hypothetical protein n=1 Tax=Chitinophaga sp. RAB17 TaxID=3233049 RepID=UPI003F914B39